MYCVPVVGSDLKPFKVIGLSANISGLPTIEREISTFPVFSSFATEAAALVASS